MTIAPIAAPTPSVEASRKRDRVYAGRVWLAVEAATVGALAASATARVSGSMCGTSLRTSRVTSRAHRNPHTIAMTAPMTATIQLMTSPTRRHATPIAKAIGQRLGPGTCGVSCPVSLKTGLELIQPCEADGREGKSPMPYSPQRAVTRSRISSLITISSGHGRASSSGSLWVASMPSLPP